MQVSTQFMIKRHELLLLTHQLDQNIQYYKSWRDLADSIHNIALNVIVALAALNVLYFASPLAPLLFFAAGDMISVHLFGFYRMNSYGVKEFLAMGRSIFSAKGLLLAGIVNGIAALVLVPCFLGGHLGYRHYDEKVRHLLELRGLIENKKPVPEKYQKELQGMILKLREKTLSNPILQAIQNASLPQLDEETQINLLTEQAIHEIIPGLFLGGSDYKPSIIHRYGSEEEEVTFDQIIRATHWNTVEGFKPSRGTAVYEFPGDQTRNPVDVTLESLKADNQAHLKKAIEIMDETLEKGKNVFVHCQQGKDRSATVVIAYIMSKYKVSLDQALTFVRSKRWIAEPGDAYLHFLRSEFRPVALNA